MKFIEKSLVAITITAALLVSTPAFFIAKVQAQATPTPTANATSTAESELERPRTMLKEISLTLPDATDDPNYTITFVDPSGQGVDITVDDKTTTKAKSPFLLQNLAIGQHTLTFKFKNKEGLLRILTQKLMVVPKAPILDSATKTVVNKPSQVIFKGTALPQANVLIVINSQDTHTVTVNTEGQWEFIVPEPKTGVNNVIFFTVRDGIVSIPSKSFSYEYQQSATATNTETIGVEGNTFLQALQTLGANIDANRQQNPLLFYGVIGIALLAILVVVELSLRKKAAKKREEKTIAALFGSVQKDGGSIVDIIQSMQKGDKKTAVVEEKPATPEPVKKAIEALKVKLDDSDEEVEKTEEKPVTPVEKQEEKIVTETPKIVPETILKEEPKKKSFNIFGLFKKEKSANEPKKEEIVEIDKTKEPITPKVETEEKPIETKKPKKEKKTKEPEKISIEEAVETEEPEKKVLTKEEFLKQFQKGSGQDE